MTASCWDDWNIGSLMKMDAMEMDGNGGTNLGTWGGLDDLWCVLE